MSEYGSPSPRGSAKRKTEEVSQDSPLHPTRRSLIRLQLENTSLSTENLALRSRITQLEATLTSKGTENARLAREHSEISRAWLDVVQGEEGVRKEVEAEKSKLKSSEREWMTKLKSSEEARYAVQGKLETVQREQQREREEARKQAEVWEGQRRRLEERLEALRGVEKSVRELQDQIEAKDRELEDVRALLSSNNAPPSGDDSASSLRAELKRQSTLLATLEKTNVQLSRECVDLRLRRDNVESLEKEVKNLARRAQTAEDKLASVYEQLDQSRRELDSLTMTMPPVSDEENTTISLSDALSLRHKYTTLASAHSACSSRIAQLSSANLELSERLAELSREGTRRIGELEERAEVAEREARWERGTRVAGERKLRLAREELEVLRRNAASGAESTNAVLEEQLKQYQRMIDAFQSGETDGQVSTGEVPKAEMDAIAQKAEALEAELAEAKATLESQTSHIATLERDLADAELRLGSGEYNTKIWRCVEFADNPAARDHAIRKETLEKLRGENGALVERIKELEGRVGAGVNTSGEGHGMVPRETYERLKDEFEEKERGHEKRLQRLKEIFGLKSKEFLEAVFSLLGWRIKFDANGHDVRLSSMYAPRNKHGLTLKFSSQGGHFGTMQMLGGMAKGLGDVRVYWVEQRQSIPGFLAQVTLEMFEKTTFGRAAGVLPKELVQDIDELRRDWGIKGVAIAVVRKGEDGSWKEDTFGLGVADERDNPVTGRTLFAIGSNSKLFTAIATGLIIENESETQGEKARLKWTTKIKDVVPSWKLMDPVASEGTDVIDLLTHRTGLPRHDGFYGMNDDKEDLISRIRHLRPSTEFRRHWQYNNFAYAVASTFVEYLYGIAFEQYVQENILTPLGMMDTMYDGRRAIASGQRSDAFVRKGMRLDDCIHELDKRVIRDEYQGELLNVGFLPQGSMSAGGSGVMTSAKDMAIWLKMLLLRGRSPLDDTAVIPASVIAQITKPTSIPEYPLTSFVNEDLIGTRTYGLAQEMYTYRGFHVIEHRGMLPGQRSLIMRIPGKKLGIAIMVNDHEFGMGFVQGMQRMIMDCLLGLESIDWARMGKADIFKGLKAALPPVRPTNPREPTILSARIPGTYVDKAYGEMIIYAVDQSSNTRLPQSCREVVEADQSLFADSSTVPILISHFPKFWSTHLVFKHRTGSTFTVHSRTVCSETGATMVAAMLWFDAVFSTEGMTFARGAWEAGAGVEPRKLKEDKLKESAEIWFDKR